MNLKKMLRILAALLAGVLLMMTTACTPEAVDIRNGVPKSEYPFTVNGITIREAVGKVAVFDDSLTDVVVYLGDTSKVKLAARAETVTHPAVEALPTAGTADAPDIEAMKKLKIDLILTDEAFVPEVSKKLDDAGIQVLVCPPATSRAELTTLYRAVACAMLGGKTGYAIGEKRSTGLLMAIDDILRIVPEQEVPIVTGFVLDEAGTFATDLTLAGNLLSYARAVNLAAEQNQFTAEELQLAAPSALFCAYGLDDVLKGNPLFGNLPAVKQGKLTQLARGELIWQGEGLVDGLMRVAVTLYPELDQEGLLPDNNTRPEDRPSNPENEGKTYPRYVDANSSSADIRILQERLIELGYLPAPSTGQYTYWTRACVKQFQGIVKLEPTGIADEATMDALFSDSAPKF
ncbi:MAG: peptidoglycan-binding protein [Clostridia bacterium]|nr:peptidoglycan-binding protein [Clostridia bacterium]